MPTLEAPPRAGGRAASFFQGLGRRGHQPLLGRVRGSIRFDVRDGERAGHWFVLIDRGHVAVSRRHDAADAVVETAASVLDGIVSGQVNTTAAVLRGEVRVQGDLHLLLMFDRLMPGPPTSSGSPALRRETR